MDVRATMTRGRNKNAVAAGEMISARQLTTIAGEPVAVPDPGQLVHLQFRRFAGCPICNLHLRSFVQRHDEVAGGGIREVVVFHSTAEELCKYEGDLPFAVIADPGKGLYREFGVESSPRALLSPRLWAALPRVLWSVIRAPVGQRHRVPPMNPVGGGLGLPADFLITRDGRAIAVKYGQHAYDQWSVDDLLARVPSGGYEILKAGRLR